MSLNTPAPAPEPAAAPPPALIDRYEEIAAASRSMLAAAHQGDWAGVEAIEQRCRELIAALKLAGRSASLSDAEKQRRMRLLRAILADDAQIRQRVEPWLSELEHFLAASAPSPRRDP